MKNPSFKLAISNDGVVEMIYSDAAADFLEQGEAVITRASHVEPNPSGAGWIADMSPVAGPTLGPFHLRSEALAAEVEYLERLLF